MERSLGCLTLEHQVLSGREVELVTRMYTRTSGFGQAATSVNQSRKICHVDLEI